MILTDLGRDPYMTGEILDKIRAFQTEENEELLARLALVQYDKMLDTLDEAVKGLKATVDDANAASAGNFMKMLTRDNFRRKGRNYVKDTLVAVTLIGGLKYETHTIEGYKDYRVSIRDVSADMAVPDDSMIGELGFAGLQGLLKRALEGLEEEQERIFGGESTYINQWNQSHSETYKEEIKYISESGIQYREVERTRYWTTVEYDDSLSAKDYRSRLAAWEKLAASEKRQSRYIELRGGEFNRHSGYAPQFKSSPNSELSLGQWQENLQFEGLGEKGRIIGLYMQHQLIQAAGEGDFAKPFYARKIWDDRGDAFKSPTLRSVVEVVGAVAAAVASAASFGTATPLAVALIATGVGIADDVLFTALDIGTGYKEADEALLALGKKTLTSFATNLIGVGIRGGGMLEAGEKAFGGLAGAMGEFGESVVGSTLLHGTQAISTNVVSSAINAIGSDNWGESFLEGAFGGNAMAGVVSGMVGSFVSGNLNHGFSQGDFGRAMGDWSSAHRGYLGALSSTVGGVFSTTINYGLTGSANINLLNSSMFGLGNTGLLEMRFGRGGFSMQFGMGGTDLSVGRLVGAVRGINVIHQNQRSLAYELDNSYKLASVLRSSYSYGGRSSRSQFDRIIEGTDRLHEGFPTGPGGRGKTIADGEGGRDVYLEPFYNDKSSRMRAAVILSHESYRDGITTDEVTQRLETLRAVRGHTETAIRINQDYGGKLPFWDENIEMDMMMYFLGDKAAFKAYADANYDSSADNWRLMKTIGGFKFVDDGETNFDLSMLSLGRDVSPEDLASLMRRMENWNKPRFVAPRPYDSTGEKLTEDEMEAYTDAYNAANPHFSNPHYRDFTDAAKFDEGFRNGVLAFVDASIAAEALMGALTPENINTLNAALMVVQESGYLLRHPSAVDTEGLIGGGTDDNPYLAGRGDGNGKITVTGWPGFRFVNDSFYKNLYHWQVKTGRRSQQWLDRVFPLRDFSENPHNGADLVGSGDVVAQVGGSLSIGYGTDYGLSAFIVSSADPSLGYFSGHLSPQSVMDYITLVSTAGTTLQNREGSYHLDGVLPGMVLGQQGSTGTATGNHIHNEIREWESTKGIWKANHKRWDEVFRDSGEYTDSFVVSDWVRRNTGYDTDPYSDPRLWENLREDWYDYGSDYMNYPQFSWDNHEKAPPGLGLNWDDWSYYAGLRWW